MPRIVTEILVDGEWIDISGDVHNRQLIDVSWGRKDYSSKVTHTKSSPQINNKNGVYSRRNPNSIHFRKLTRNTRIRQSVELPDGSFEFLYHGEVSSWPKRWDLSGNDAYIPTNTSGFLRRLGQGTRALRDSLRRRIQTSDSLLAYWPLTDGENAREGAEIAGGGQPMRALGSDGSFTPSLPDWTNGEIASWLDPVVALKSDTSGDLIARVNLFSDAATERSVDVFRSGIGGADAIEIWDSGAGTDTENNHRIQIGLDGATGDISIFRFSVGETASSFALVDDVEGAGIFDDEPHYIRWTTTVNGSDTDYELYLDGELAASGTMSGIVIKAVSRLAYGWANSDDDISVGHITYWGPDKPTSAEIYDALLGHPNELAGRRIERVCAEQGVSLIVNGDLDTTPAMGPQTSGKFLKILRDAEAVDGGILGESRENLALEYRTRFSKYNQGD